MKSHIVTLGMTLLISQGCAHLGFNSSCEAEIKTFGDQDFQVKTLSYQPARPAEKTLIIFPPTGGTNTIDKNYAATFCKNGFQVYILDSWTKDQETEIDFEIHQSFYSKAQKAIGLVIQNTKTSFIGVLGTSVGGLHASLAASTHEQLDAAFVITGGTPIAEVVVYSSQEAMQDLKKRRAVKFQVASDEEQVRRIGQVFNLELQTLEKKFNGKDLGLSIATKDTVVPTTQQLNLKNLWQPQTVIEIKNDHFWGIVKTWLFHKKEILKFFQNSAEKKLMGGKTKSETNPSITN